MDTYQRDTSHGRDDFNHQWSRVSHKSLRKTGVLVGLVCLLGLFCISNTGSNTKVVLKQSFVANVSVAEQEKLDSVSEEVKEHKAKVKAIQESLKDAAHEEHEIQTKLNDALDKLRQAEEKAGIPSVTTSEGPPAFRVMTCLQEHCNSAIAKLGMSWNDPNATEALGCVSKKDINKTSAVDCFPEAKLTSPSVTTLGTCALCNGCMDGAKPDKAVCDALPKGWNDQRGPPSGGGGSGAPSHYGPPASGGGGGGGFDWQKFLPPGISIPGIPGGQ